MLNIEITPKTVLGIETDDASIRFKNIQSFEPVLERITDKTWVHVVFKTDCGHVQNAAFPVGLITSVRWTEDREHETEAADDAAGSEIQ